MQVSSSIQNQDFTVIDDYITGLKALLYLQVNSKEFFSFFIKYVCNNQNSTTDLIKQLITGTVYRQ